MSGATECVREQRLARASGASRGHLERCGPGPDGQRAKSNEHLSGDLALGEANLKLLVTGRVEAQSHS